MTHEELFYYAGKKENINYPKELKQEEIL